MQLRNSATHHEYYQVWAHFQPILNSIIVTNGKAFKWRKDPNAGLHNNNKKKDQLNQEHNFKFH